MFNKAAPAGTSAPSSACGDRRKCRAERAGVRAREDRSTTAVATAHKPCSTASDSPLMTGVRACEPSPRPSPAGGRGSTNHYE
ncbi:hypothetical protein AZ78_2114 [Lysobacter capsici AZ78]|uniref:Uncharacterized protein n=1 Tax=Lysobacter capsici AZ78 TaxID=1444315 RepID=A0A108U8M3_9GAMM|nr:hypothetical protein AZ78_2114 [Lysobacter capsici AZ78]